MGVIPRPSYIERPLREAIAAAPSGSLSRLRDARFFITGATGFFGQWILEAIVELNDSLNLGLRAQCASRDPGAFLARRPDLAARSELEWQTVSAGALGGASINPECSHFLHMAASSDARDYQASPANSLWSIIQDARHASELASRAGAHLHFVSSGAVYGPKRASFGPCRESDALSGAPDPLNPAAAYANAKRSAESIVACSSPSWSISRPFAFLGPGLPLNLHFAAGNFIRDAASGLPIAITSDGSPLRSYLHPADLAAWTLALCGLAPHGRAINIGSDQPVSLAQLARLISLQAGSPGPVLALAPTPGADVPAYCPSVEAASAFGLRQSQPLESCILDTLAWAKDIQ